MTTYGAHGRIISCFRLALHTWGEAINNQNPPRSPQFYALFHPSVALVSFKNLEWLRNEVLNPLYT